MKDVVIIFDMDGTIIESESEKAISHCEVLKKFSDKSTIDPEIYKNCIGSSFETVAHFFMNHTNISIPLKLYIEEFNKIYLTRLKKIYKPIDCFYEFLNSIKQNGLKTGLVTSSNHFMVDIVLKNIDLLNQFDVIVSKEDVTKEKPNSEPYELAVKLLKAQDCIVFEDTSVGFISAANVTENIFAIKHYYNEYQDFRLVKRIFSSYCEIDITKIIKE